VTEKKNFHDESGAPLRVGNRAGFLRAVM